MCGISGFISKTKQSSVPLVTMTKVIRHRGPDDEGFILFNDDKFEVLGSSDTAKDCWSLNTTYSPKIDISKSSFDGEVGFGHRRLSIIDLSSRGHQPMSSIDNRYWITFNGEIYNYTEIRNELILLGYVFSSDTDTEVILSAYKEWGVECQHRFNGMWAFAIYDRQEKTIFLSRDRFGIKPIYYWFSPAGVFYFASEIKQFTVLPSWKATLNGPRAMDYLYFALTDHTDETLFKGVNIILPGHYFIGDINSVISNSCNKIRQNKWYTFPKSFFNGSFEDAKYEFLSRFKNSIELHLRSDVPVGCTLSGGLDSSCIVSYINVILKEKGVESLQKTFSSCSIDSRFDERFWIDKVVNQTKVEAHYVYPQGEDIFSITDKLIWQLDEPYQSQSAFLGYHVFEMARKNNVIVLLNGQGADEFLSGYSEFRLLRQKIMFIEGKLKTLIKEVSFKGLFTIFFTIIYELLPSQLRFRISFFSKNNRLKNRIINSKLLVKKKKHPYEINKYNKYSHKTISEYQLLKEPLQKYLRWEDRNSMAHSVEARVPLLDYRLVEFANSLPLTYLDQPEMSKLILTEALSGILSETVRNRKDKKGFITPEEKWFKEEHYDNFIKMFKSNVNYAKGIIRECEVLEYFDSLKKGKVKFDYTYFQMILFCIWMKVFDVQLPLQTNPSK